MNGYTPGEQPQDKTYIKLNTNENPYPPAPAIANHLTQFCAETLRLYPDPVANKLRTEAAKQIGKNKDWILCGNGSDDLLTIALRTFVDEGGNIAFPVPTYSLYPVLAKIQGATFTEVNLTYDFQLPENFLEQVRGSALLFLARPNAPTGNTFPVNTIEHICAEFNGIVWIDEAYADFAADNCLPLVEKFPNVVVSRSFSKSYSLAGLRLGLAFAQPALIEQMLKVKDSYNIDTITQQLGLIALQNRDWMEHNRQRIIETREHIASEMTKRNCEVIPSESNFIFLKPPIPARKYFEQLRENGILVRYFPGELTGNYVRITIGHDQDMEKLLHITDEIFANNA